VACGFVLVFVVRLRFFFFFTFLFFLMSLFLSIFLSNLPHVLVFYFIICPLGLYFVFILLTLEIPVSSNVPFAGTILFAPVRPIRPSRHGRSAGEPPGLSQRNSGTCTGRSFQTQSEV